MNETSNLETLKAEFAEVERRYLTAYLFSLALLVLGVALLVKTFMTHAPLGLASTLLILVCTVVNVGSMYVVAQKKKAILVKHGFLCQSCHKTPRAFEVKRAVNSGCCPRCQLKY